MVPKFQIINKIKQKTSKVMFLVIQTTELIYKFSKYKGKKINSSVIFYSSKISGKTYYRFPRNRSL